MPRTTDFIAERYRLVGLLGRGGMSAVYKAVDERNGRTVAVKIVRAGDPLLAQRMAQEARALERLRHPGLVRLLDVGVAHGQPFLVMELVDGPTLAATLRGGPLGAEGSAALGARLGDALGYVHAQGIVHRDVKPSNILLSAGGEARLGDFGIARLLDASTLTVNGTTLGTAAYMAPEQLEDHQVGPSADVWSLGMVLLECLTGHRVYEGTASEVVARRLAGPVPLPAGLPVPWKLVLSGMLDHRPDQRLDGTEVAALLATPAFSSDWDPSGIPKTALLDPTAPHDLTALAPGLDANGALATQGTRVNRSTVAIDSRPRHAGRWWLGALGAVLLAGALSTGLLLGLGSSPVAAGHEHGRVVTAARHATTTTTTTVPPTTTTTVPPTTTTTLPNAPTALGNLVRDLAAAESAGTIDSATAQSISTPAQQALTDESSGAPDKSANDLQAAAVAIATAAQKGNLAQAEAGTLQSDVSTLAAALGLGAAGEPPTTTTTSTTNPPPAAAPNAHGGPHGQGH